MSVDEAALQLDLQSDHFLVFENAETNKVNVLYARNDETYGLIEPPY
jgi:putative sigma-54 modulation protein